jgi:hypothetical protein
MRTGLLQPFCRCIGSYLWWPVSWYHWWNRTWKDVPRPCKVLNRSASLFNRMAGCHQIQSQGPQTDLRWVSLIFCALDSWDSSLGLLSSHWVMDRVVLHLFTLPLGLLQLDLELWSGGLRFYRLSHGSLVSSSDQFFRNLIQILDPFSYDVRIGLRK